MTNQIRLKCPVCACHFPGKVMDCDEYGYLQERECGRCRGSGFIQIGDVFANAVNLGSYCIKCEEQGIKILVKDCPHKEDLTIKQ